MCARVCMPWVTTDPPIRDCLWVGRKGPLFSERWAKMTIKHSCAAKRTVADSCTVSKLADEHRRANKAAPRWIQSLAQTAHVYPLTRPYLQNSLFPSCSVQVFWDGNLWQLILSCSNKAKKGANVTSQHSNTESGTLVNEAQTSPGSFTF